MEEEKNKKIQWHPAFAAALDLEFARYRNDLVTERDYNLNTSPIRIDLLVIKKKTDIVIENEIGMFFKGYNIMEYKSPEDSLSIDTVYKTIAYASLYKAYGETADERKADDITVSLVRQGKPEKLFRYFKEHGDKVSNPAKGIYYIDGKYPFPMQIVVIKELEGKSHIWIKALSDKLKEEELKYLIRNVQKLTGKQDRESADSVLEVSIKANKEAADKLKGDDEAMCNALYELMKPEIDKKIMQKEKEARDEGIREGKLEGMREGKLEGMREGKLEGMREGKLEGVREGIMQGTVETLRDMGYSDDEIRKRIMKKHNLSLEEAKGYL